MSDSQPKFDDQFQSAEALQEAGRQLEALAAWKSLALRYDDAAAFCRWGQSARAVGDPDGAEQAFRGAISADNQCSPAYVGLALVLLEADRDSEAEASLRQALQYEKNALTYSLLGSALVRLDRKREAAEAYRAALALDPAYEEALYNLATLEEKDDPLAAQQHLLEAIEIDPDHAAVHRELGWVFKKSGDDLLAEYHVRRAIELDSNDVWARIYLGNIRWKANDVPSALAEFESAIRLRPHWGYAYCCLANVYENEENWDKAESLYRKAIELEPGHEVIYMNFGRMFKKKGDGNSAREQLRLALDLDPNCEKAREILRSLDDPTADS